MLPMLFWLGIVAIIAGLLIAVYPILLNWIVAIALVAAGLVAIYKSLPSRAVG